MRIKNLGPRGQRRYGFVVVVSAAHSKFPLPLAQGEKVADRPDEGVIRCFCRSEMLNGVALPGNPVKHLFAEKHWSSGSTARNVIAQGNALGYCIFVIVKP